MIAIEQEPFISNQTARISINLLIALNISIGLQFRVFVSVCVVSFFLFCCVSFLRFCCCWYSIQSPIYYHDRTKEKQTSALFLFASIECVSIKFLFFYFRVIPRISAAAAVASRKKRRDKKRDCTNPMDS